MKRILTALLFATFLNTSLYADKLDELINSYEMRCARIQLEANKRKQQEALSLDRACPKMSLFSLN